MVGVFWILNNWDFFAFFFPLQMAFTISKTTLVDIQAVVVEGEVGMVTQACTMDPERVATIGVTKMTGVLPEEVTMVRVKNLSTSAVKFWISPLLYFMWTSDLLPQQTMEELLSLPLKIGPSYCQEMTELRGTGFLIRHQATCCEKFYLFFYWLCMCNKLIETWKFP